MKDPNFKDEVGEITTINQLKQLKPYSKLSGRFLEIAVQKDYNLTNEQYNALYRVAIDKDKIELKDLALTLAGVGLGFFSGNIFTTAAGVTLTVYEVGNIIRKAVSGYGSEERTAFKIAYIFEMLKNASAKKLNNMEIDFVKKIARDGGSKDFHAYIAIFQPNRNLPKSEENAIKKGLLKYNSIKDKKNHVTYDEVIEMLQRDYYYRKYNADSRVYVNSDGKRVESALIRREKENVR